MAWVLVPVPEELEPEVGALVFQLRFRASVAPWGPDLMEEHLRSLGDRPRAVLSTVAAAVRGGHPIEDVQLADQLEVSVLELFGLVQDANDVTVGKSPSGLLHSRLEEVVDETGSRRRRVLFMPGELAEMVREGEGALGLRTRTSAES